MAEVRVGWREISRRQSAQTGQTTRFIIERETIPIVFVPGIMGSRLKRIVNGEDRWIWDPDRDLGMLWNYGLFTNARKKQQKILGTARDGADLLVDEEDAGYARDHGKELAKLLAPVAPPDLIERGWPGVSWAFYGAVLERLQAKEARRSWPAPISTFFRLPVYACGYNWTQSNRRSGALLKARIEAILARHRQAGERCDQVVLVTHSMGGLVARSACVLHGASSSVLGVIHGVQPVTGAPVAYWRMKAGFERTGGLTGTLAAWTLGDDQKEVTALLGNMAGGLQLLPNRDYRTSGGAKEWLRVQGMKSLEQPLPRQDAYEEIYRARTGPLKLVTDRYLVPEGSPSAVEAAWTRYLINLSEAQGFHEELGLRAHPETQVFLGTGTAHPTADEVIYARGEWPADPPQISPDGIPFPYTPEEPAEGTEICFGGHYRVLVKEGGKDFALELQDFHGAGDGTVPESSGKAVAPRGKALQGEPPVAREFPGVEHAGAYATGAGHGAQGDTIDFVVRSIEKLCRMKIREARGHR